MEDHELPTRWEVELEVSQLTNNKYISLLICLIRYQFVQGLANLQYLNFLAQNKYLEDPKFLNYLKYLEYWRDPKYTKFLVYPYCLHILTLLQSERFRMEITRNDLANLVLSDMIKKWKLEDEEEDK